MDPYRPQRDSYEIVPSGPAITTVGPTQDFPGSNTIAADSPDGAKVERVISATGSIASTTRTNDSNASRFRQRLAIDRLWGTKLHWFLPSAMIGLFILGMLGSLLHHWFYLSLDGKKADDQLIMVRFGTAFAFFTKAALVGSIVLAYRQRIWYTLRTKEITIKGIDNLFALTEDPTCFYSKDVAFRAKVATAMALATWAIPLAAVLSPGALTAQPTQVESEAACSIPTFNTSAENDAIIGHPKHGIGGYDLTNYNGSESPRGKPYFDDIGYQLSQGAMLSSYLARPLQVASPCKGYNCTWDVEFDAPWYECKEKSVEEARRALYNTSWGSDVNGSSWAPLNRITLYVVSDGEEYSPNQPPYQNGSNNRQGYFMQEPTIRIGYVVDTNIPVVEGSIDSNNGAWKTVFEPHWLSCDLFKASWKANFNFTDEKQSITFKTSNLRRVFQPPMMGPTHPMYRENALYYAFGKVLRNRLSNGYGFKAGYLDTTPYSDFHPLVNATTRLAINDVKGGVEKLVSDLALTLLSIPYLEISLNTTTQCKKWRYENRFHYSRPGLWIGYAISVIITLASVLVGVHSIYVNGITSDTVFSKILVTTRNPTLDKLVEDHQGVCLGGDPFPEVLEKTRLRFGIIDRGDGTTHTAFGTAGETAVMLGSEKYRVLENIGPLR
ncbi:hypothetical protein L873DRAFT_1792549 [Choiromyces venosus 120613-1]|uniref:Uncharacterized protein n=1 Tax=Choiromyces venosus 120613-1 TaxID=1336337 RepID=A0A3N4JM14_9PEZI|nr:hypothetical protein L873DRAFT_1792549 [Choiromyces venosus 120613-1]